MILLKIPENNPLRSQYSVVNHHSPHCVSALYQPVVWEETDTEKKTVKLKTKNKFCVTFPARHSRTVTTGTHWVWTGNCVDMLPSSILTVTIRLALVYSV